MTVLITLTTAGTDSGPFDLYSDLDGYTSAFESGVSKASLLAGYASALVPDYTNIIRVKSNGDCVNYIDIPLPGYTTTTSSTTKALCISYTIQPHNGIIHIVEYIPCGESLPVILEVGPEDTEVVICIEPPLISDNYPEYTVAGSPCLI